METTRTSVGLLLAVLCVGCGSDGTGGTGDGPAGPPDLLMTPPGALGIWTAGPGRKIQPSTVAGSSRQIAVASYRDAYVSSQLVVHGIEGHLDGVTVSVPADLSDGKGHALAKKELVFFREGYTNFGGVDRNIGTGNEPVPQSSPTKDPLAPDALIPLIDPYSGGNAGQPFDVPQGANQPLFLDVHVPRGQAAGVYTGTIHVAATVGGEEDIPISVTVWDLDIPDMREVHTHFKMSIIDIYQYHGGIANCSGGNCYLDTSKPVARTIVRRYEDLAHAHRIDTGQAMAFQPVSGCNPPDKSSWDAYDAAMAPYMDGSWFSDGVPSTRFTVPFAPGQEFGIDGQCNQQQYQALSAAWAAHLRQKGWFPRPAGGGFGAVAYAYDEPLAAGNAQRINGILNGIVEKSTWMAGGDPAWRDHIIVTTAPVPAPAMPATSPLLDAAIGVYVVALVLYDDFWQHGPFYGRTGWQQNPNLFGKGLKLWFYEGNAILPPYLTLATNTLDALEPVLMMWGSWLEKATGFLYWDISYWEPRDPWGPNIRFGKTGDGVLIYPGHHNGQMAPIGSPPDVAIDGPIPTIRLKMVRQGLQDWALFRVAEAKGHRAFVEQQLATIYKQFGAAAPAPMGSPYWVTDEAKMEEIRAKVVGKVLGM